jgi:FG-GAP-like repeat/FG-GAP repeat
MRASRAVVFALLLTLGAGSLPAADEDAPGTLPYGFRGHEIYKLERGVFGLRTADVDGDGRLDLLFVNNAKARIDVYLRREKPVAAPVKIGEVGALEITGDRFFEEKKILTEKTVYAMVTGDLNGDGKVDIAYYGKPAELVVAYGDGKGGFEETRTFDVKDVAQRLGALDTGDLDGDGLDDLVVLTKENTEIYFQGKDHKLQPPVRIPFSAKAPSSAGVVDMDGDGLGDLVQIAFAEPRPLRVRFQKAGGQLGPEVTFKLPSMRSLGFEDIDPKPGRELLVIQRSSGLLRSLGLARREAGGGTGIPLGSIRVHPFDASRGAKKRAMDVGDVNGDGRADIVVTEPGSAQVAIYVQTDDGRLESPRNFPSLAESDEVCVAKLTAGVRQQILVLSRKEKAVGLTTLDADGRLPFPDLLGVPGSPQSMGVADMNADGTDDVVVMTKHEKAWKAVILGIGEKDEVVIQGTHVLKGMGDRDRPDDILLMDLDRNGRMDILIFDDYRAMRVFSQAEDGTFVDASAQPQFRTGLVDKKKRSDVAPVDLDGDGKLELLVSAKNFARALVLGEKGDLSILDQVNGRSTASLIKGAVSVDLTGDGKAEVVLLDGKDNVVTVLKRGKDGVFEAAASFPVGKSSFESIFAEDLNGDGRRDLVILGSTRFGIMYAGGTDAELREVHTFESPIRDAFLYSFATGDMNGDGHPDVVLSDVGNNMVEIVSYRAESGFKHEMKWRVFEEKNHQGRKVGSRGEPRELDVGDVDGDGKDDVVLMVHDRIIVYLQD